MMLMMMWHCMHLEQLKNHLLYTMQSTFLQLVCTKHLQKHVSTAFVNELGYVND